MAELTAPETTADSCCAPEAQASCCKPSAKAKCCGHDEGCDCAAGSDQPQPEGYAAATAQVTMTDPGAGCCVPSETFE